MASDENWEEVPTEQWEEVPLNENDKKAAPVEQYDPDSFIENYAIPGLQSLGAGVSDLVGGVSNVLDKYSGAPARAGIQKVAQGKPEQAWQAARQQFGEDPTKAPSGKDIAAGLGVSTKEYETPIILNPFVQKGGKLTLSPAGVIGGFGEAVVDPTNVIPWGGIGKGAVKAAKGMGNVAGKFGRGIAPPIGKVVARVPPETTRAFIKSPREIEETAKLYQTEDIKNILDETVDEARRGVTGAEEKKKALEEMLRQKMRDKKFDLQRPQVDQQIVSNIQNQLGNQKKLLGKMSDEADDALVRDSISFRKQDLLNFVDQIGASYGGYFAGEGREEALARWMKYRERLGSYPDIIPPTLLRDTMRQIRDDSSWNLSAGKFNKELDVMRKTLTEKMSDVLKRQSPDYANLMGQMAPMSRNLEKMSDLWGSVDDPSKGLQTLQTIKKGNAANTEYLRGLLRQNAVIAKDPTILKELQNWQKDNVVLERMQRGQDLSNELFPQDVGAVSDAERALMEAEARYAPVKRLTPYTDKTQSVIRRQGTPTASIEDARALEAAGQLAGMDIPEIIRRRNIYDAFEKDATTGARGAVMGGAIGSNFGEFGAAIGALTGGAVDRYGGRLLRSGIRSGTSLKNSYDNMLEYLRTSPEFAEKYGRKIQNALKYGTRSGVLYHKILMNNDPEYRAYFQEAQQ